MAQVQDVPAVPKPPAVVELLLPNSVDPPNVLLLFDGVEPKPRCDKIKFVRHWILANLKIPVVSDRYPLEEEALK